MHICKANQFIIEMNSILTVCCRIVGWEERINWKGNGRKQSQANLFTSPKIV